jgi:hypothetical protein
MPRRFPGSPNFCLGEPVGRKLFRGLWPSPEQAQATGGLRRPDGESAGPRSGLPGRFAFGAVLPLAALSAFGGFLLTQQTAAHRRALVLMAQVEERIGQEHVLKRQAILDPRRGPELAERLREAQRQLSLDLDALEADEARVGAVHRFLRLEGGPRASSRVRAAVQAQEAAVDEAFALLLAGRLDQARAVAPRKR